MASLTPSCRHSLQRAYGCRLGGARRRPALRRIPALHRSHPFWMDRRSRHLTLVRHGGPSGPCLGVNPGLLEEDQPAHREIPARLSFQPTHPQRDGCDPAYRLGLAIFLVATAAMTLVFALAVVGHGKPHDPDRDENGDRDQAQRGLPSTITGDPGDRISPESPTKAILVSSCFSRSRPRLRSRSERPRWRDRPPAPGYWQVG